MRIVDSHVRTPGIGALVLGCKQYCESRGRHVRILDTNAGVALETSSL